MNKKGFTLVELLGVIVVLAILLTLVVFAYSRYLSASRDKLFRVAVNSFEDSTLEAITDCTNGTHNSFCTNHSIPEMGESITVTLAELEANNYIERIKNPYDKGGDPCTGTIVATRETTADKSNISFTYKTCLVCGETGNKARFTMGSIMYEKGSSDSEIASCTGLSSTEINSLK